MRGTKPLSEQWDFINRVLLVLGLTVLVVALALLTWVVARVLVLIFAGILFAVFLRGLTEAISRRTGMPQKVALALVGIVSFVVIGLTLWFLATQVLQQFDDFARAIRAARLDISQRLTKYEISKNFLNLSSLDVSGAQGLNWFDRITGMFSTFFDVGVDVVVIFFVGIYLTINPELYKRGLLHLFPVAVRPRINEVMDTVGYTLYWWFLGRLINMAIIGVLTAIGLWALGIPLVLPLSIIALVLDFIPFFGPVLSAVPAILIGFTNGGTSSALYVLILYVAIQSCESYLIQPLIQSRAVELPPVLTIVGQLFAGAILGGVGVAFATPLTVASMVLVKMLYVEETLDDHSVHVAGKDAGASPPGERSPPNRQSA